MFNTFTTKYSQVARDVFYVLFSSCYMYIYCINAHFYLSIVQRVLVSFLNR